MGEVREALRLVGLGVHKEQEGTLIETLGMAIGKQLHSSSVTLASRDEKLLLAEFSTISSGLRHPSTICACNRRLSEIALPSEPGHFLGLIPYQHRPQSALPPAAAS